MISHKRHYVKWMVNWWKIPLLWISNKRFYVKCDCHKGFLFQPSLMKKCIQNRWIFKFIIEYKVNKSLPT